MKNKLFLEIIKKGYVKTNRFEYIVKNGVILKRIIGTEEWVATKKVEQNNENLKTKQL